MPFVAKKGDLPQGQQPERGRLDVVAVGVRQHRRPDPGQARPDPLQPGRERPRPQAQVNQESGMAGLHQAGIPPRSAGKHGELDRHRASRSLSTTK